MTDPPFDLARVYGARDLDELRTEYDRIAGVYDADGWDWLGPAMILEAARRFVALDALILDVGAGTGQLGIALREAGYPHLDAMDLSPGMLAIAAGRGVYGGIREGRLGEPLDYADDAFDAAVASGVFTTGHAPPTGLPELTRIVRPGGHVLFTLRSDETPPGFEEMMQRLVQDGAWTLAERGEEVVAMPRTAPDVRLRAWVFVVC